MGLIAREANTTTARVLVWDIERRPPVVFSWNFRGDMYISPEQIIDPGGTLAWSAQWVGEKRVRFMSDHHDGHEAMIRGLHALLSECEISVGFNHESFDRRHMNDEFDELDLPRLPPTQSIDLLKICRSEFRLPHNTLKYISQRFGIAPKMANDGWALWTCCVTDPESKRPYLGPVPVGGGCLKHSKQLKRYSVQDTRTTMELYHYLKRGGWIRKHPHVGLFGGDPDGCPACGSSNRTPTKNATTATSSFPGFRCDDCQHLYRGVRRLGTTTGTRAV